MLPMNDPRWLNRRQTALLLYTTSQNVSSFYGVGQVMFFDSVVDISLAMLRCTVSWSVADKHTYTLTNTSALNVFFLVLFLCSLRALYFLSYSCFWKRTWGSQSNNHVRLSNWLLSGILGSWIESRQFWFDNSSHHISCDLQSNGGDGLTHPECR